MIVSDAGGPEGSQSRLYLICYTTLQTQTLIGGLYDLQGPQLVCCPYATRHRLITMATRKQTMATRKGRGKTGLCVIVQYDFVTDW